MENTLFIDATDFNRVVFGFSNGKKMQKKSYKVDPHKSHELIMELESFLKDLKNKNLKIAKIFVNKGPGSYTGVRVSISIAMALGLGWGAKVSALEKQKFLAKLIDK